MIGYKVFTSDLRPIQGGELVWDGVLPHDLPTVRLDTSDQKCGEGWNFCRRAHYALSIAGLWPDGKPSRLFVVEPIGDVVEHGDKCRASSIRIVEEITDLRPAIRELSEPFGNLRDEMISEQLAWRDALARPEWDPAAVEMGLRSALKARGLDWKMKEFKNTEDAWDAWETWQDWDELDDYTICAIRDTRDAWTPRFSQNAWFTCELGNTWDAWDTRPSRTANPAWDALTHYYVSRRGWISHPADLMTVGIRDAYRNGLAIALPTGPGELGWAMKDKAIDRLQDFMHK